MARKNKRRQVSATLTKRLAQVEACERLGESIKSYAERHGVPPHTLYEAKKQARRLGLLPPRHRGASTEGSEVPKKANGRLFVEATLQPPAVSVRNESAPAWRLRFPGGEVLEAGHGLGIEDAVRLIGELRTSR